MKDCQRFLLIRRALIPAKVAVGMCREIVKQVTHVRHLSVQPRGQRPNKSAFSIGGCIALNLMFPCMAAPILWLYCLLEPMVKTSSISYGCLVDSFDFLKRKFIADTSFPSLYVNAAISILKPIYMQMLVVYW